MALTDLLAAGVKTPGGRDQLTVLCADLLGVQAVSLLMLDETGRGLRSTAELPGSGLRGVARLVRPADRVHRVGRNSDLVNAGRVAAGRRTSRR